MRIILVNALMLKSSQKRKKTIPPIQIADAPANSMMPVSSPDQTKLIELVFADMASLRNAGHNGRIETVVKIPNQYSIVYRVSAQLNGSRHIGYIKVPHKKIGLHAIQEQRLSIEFGILKQFSSDANHTDLYGVAEPIGLYPAWPAIATFEAGREELRTKIIRAAQKLQLNKKVRQETEREVAYCGEWLKSFQRQTRCIDCEIDSSEVSSYLDPRVRELVSQKIISLESGQALIDITSQQAAALNRRDISITGRHNDYSGHNILSNNGKIRVIDFSMYDQGPSIYDPSNFLFSLELLKFDTRLSPAYLEHLRDAFREAYGASPSQLPMYEIAMCRYLVNRLLATPPSKSTLVDLLTGVNNLRTHCIQELQNFISKHRRASNIGL